MLSEMVQKIQNLKKYIDENQLEIAEMAKEKDVVKPKIKVEEKAENNNIEIDIEADGGINLATAPDVKKAGANILVAGTAILIAKDYGEIIKELAK